MYNISQDIVEHYKQYITKNYSFILTNIFIMVIIPKSLISREQACHIFDTAISWETRKIQILFRLKGNKLYPVSKINYGVCEYGEDYIGETKRNTQRGT